MNSPQSGSDRRNPVGLLKKLVVVGWVSGLFITSLGGYSYYRISSNHILKQAESDAVNISTALAELEKPVIFSIAQDGEYRPSVTPEEIPRLDKRLRTFLRPFDIVKIKIYSIDSQIVFSTDSKIIGTIDSNNKRLKRALQGYNDTHLENKSEFKDLANERMIDVSVVESYVPIRDKDNHVIGCFEIYVNVTKYYREIVREVLYSVLALGAIIIFVYAFAYIVARRAATQLKEAQDKLEELAVTDFLTGLFNRRHIIERSSEELIRIARQGKSHGKTLTLGFIMFDIDNFKSVNDSYGHLFGDEVLVAFGDQARKVCRQYDMVGRYGGEEFLVALPDIAVGDIGEIADRIRNGIKNQPFIFEGKEVKVTVSSGISFCHPEEQDIFAALKRADDALYQAKRSGKDKVCTIEKELAA